MESYENASHEEIVKQLDSKYGTKINGREWELLCNWPTLVYNWELVQSLVGLKPISIHWRHEYWSTGVFIVGSQYQAMTDEDRRLCVCYGRVICSVCRSMKQLSVVMSCKSPLNPLTNPNPVSGHWHIATGVKSGIICIDWIGIQVMDNYGSIWTSCSHCRIDGGHSKCPQRSNKGLLRRGAIPNSIGGGGLEKMKVEIDANQDKGEDQLWSDGGKPTWKS
jgi:hypothetical protein